MRIKRVSAALSATVFLLGTLGNCESSKADDPKGGAPEEPETVPAQLVYFGLDQKDQRLEDGFEIYTTIEDYSVSIWSHSEQTLVLKERFDTPGIVANSFSLDARKRRGIWISNDFLQTEEDAVGWLDGNRVQSFKAPFYCLAEAQIYPVAWREEVAFLCYFTWEGWSIIEIDFDERRCKRGRGFEEISRWLIQPGTNETACLDFPYLKQIQCTFLEDYPIGYWDELQGEEKLLLEYIRRCARPWDLFLDCAKKIKRSGRSFRQLRWQAIPEEDLIVCFLTDITGEKLDEDWFTEVVYFLDAKTATPIAKLGLLNCGQVVGVIP